MLYNVNTCIEAHTLPFYSVLIQTKTFNQPIKVIFMHAYSHSFCQDTINRFYFTLTIQYHLLKIVYLHNYLYS